jgi:hypothetical protein
MWRDKSWPEKPLDGCCLYIFEEGERKGEKCTNPIEGRGRYLYCEEHEKEGPKQAKRERDRKFRFLWKCGLTKDYFNKCRAEAAERREQLPSDKVAKYQFALDQLREIEQALLNPANGLPSAALSAKQQVWALHTFLMHQAPRTDGVIDRLIVYCQAFLRDSGTCLSPVDSPVAFTVLGRQAAKVRKMWWERRDFLNLAHALLAEVELFRLQFLANPNHPNQRHFLEQARKRLKAFTHVCDLAIRCHAGEYKQVASLLRFHVPSIEGMLALDGGEPQQAVPSIQALEHQAKAVADSSGTSPVTEILRFSCLIQQAQFSLRSNKIDSAYQCFEEAGKIFKTLQYCSIESQLEVAYVTAGLALRTHDQDRQKPLQEYISLFQLHPFLTQHNLLQELQRRYPKDVDESLFKSVHVYFDLMFRRLHPFVIHV